MRASRDATPAVRGPEIALGPHGARSQGPPSLIAARLAVQVTSTRRDNPPSPSHTHRCARASRDRLPWAATVTARGDGRRHGALPTRPTRPLPSPPSTAAAADAAAEADPRRMRLSPVTWPFTPLVPSDGHAVCANGRRACALRARPPRRFPSTCRARSLCRPATRARLWARCPRRPRLAWSDGAGVGICQADSPASGRQALSLHAGGLGDAGLLLVRFGPSGLVHWPLANTMHSVAADRRNAEKLHVSRNDPSTVRASPPAAVCVCVCVLSAWLESRACAISPPAATVHSFLDAGLYSALAALPHASTWQAAVSPRASHRLRPVTWHACDPIPSCSLRLLHPDFSFHSHSHIQCVFLPTQCVPPLDASLRDGPSGSSRAFSAGCRLKTSPRH